MAFTTSKGSGASKIDPESFTVGDVKFQLLDFSCNSGDTSGTVTADRLQRLQHVLVSGGQLRHSAAPTYATNVATLAYTVPTETKAVKTIQSAIYIVAAANLGKSGNNVTIAGTAGATAGSEVVTVTGNAISIQIASGTSTATQCVTALLASSAATALATFSTVTGHTIDTIATFAATNLTGGVQGGAQGQVLCIGK